MPLSVHAVAVWLVGCERVAVDFQAVTPDLKFAVRTKKSQQGLRRVKKEQEGSKRFKKVQAGSRKFQRF